MILLYLPSVKGLNSRWAYFFAVQLCLEWFECLYTLFRLVTSSQRAYQVHCSRHFSLQEQRGCGIRPVVCIQAHNDRLPPSGISCPEIYILCLSLTTEIRYTTFFLLLHRLKYLWLISKFTLWFPSVSGPSSAPASPGSDETQPPTSHRQLSPLLLHQNWTRRGAQRSADPTSPHQPSFHPALFSRSPLQQ